MAAGYFKPLHVFRIINACWSSFVADIGLMPAMGYIRTWFAVRAKAGGIA